MLNLSLERRETAPRLGQHPRSPVRGAQTAAQAAQSVKVKVLTTAPGADTPTRMRSRRPRTLRRTALLGDRTRVTSCSTHSANSSACTNC